MIGERYRRLFELYFGPLGNADSNGEVVISNPFRHDPNPSLHLNVETGQFNDFGSDLRGDAYGFFCEMHDSDYGTAKRCVDAIVDGKEPDIGPIPEFEVERYHSELMSNIPVRAYLTMQRGLTVAILKQYKIGWDGSRYTIPVRNDYGICINLRKYDPHAVGANKMISYAKGYGTNKLFPRDMLMAGDTIILQEGEWDTLVQISKGFPAITQTAGAGSWQKKWTPLFRHKKVYICYDCDQAGLDGARKVATQLYGTAQEVRIIKLPLEGSKVSKDITDFYVTHGYTEEDFKSLMERAPLFEPSEEELQVNESSCTDAIQLSLAEARKSQYKHKRVEFDVQVIGKDTAPYNIPEKGTFTCSACGASKSCEQCGIYQNGGELTYEFKIGPECLDYIKSAKMSQRSQMKMIAGIPSSCGKFSFEETSSMNIEEILIAPEIPEFHSWNGESSQYLVQTAYFVKDQIESNKSYKMSGIMTPDPWQQHVTFVLDKCSPLQDTVESFKMTPEIYEKLKIFQTNDVAAKFKEIHRDFEANVTHIVGRDDLLTGIDLVYHSVLGFKFQGIDIMKGWLEFLCIGDTRTGKSETTEAMMRHFQLGEMSVAENTSYAGLVGGLQQTGDKRWFLTWGKLPLNDGRLFVIDEASGLDVNDIAKMSGIRSSGIAEITKIQTERTTARTRLIWLSNPRSGNPMSSYSHGIQAVAELIGKAEDISRFDFVVSAAKDEVPMSEINKLINADDLPEQIYTSDLCKTLILWVWSRKRDDIVFETESVKDILKFATRQGEVYSSRIPLVEGANQRIKLARLSVAVAARVFSTDDTGEQIIVKPEHVKFSYDYLNQIYAKPSLNYKGFSTGEYLDAQAAKMNHNTVIAFLASNPSLGELCARQDYIWSRTFEEQLNIDRQAANELISQLARWRMITDSGTRGYKKTSGFISILREWENRRTAAELDIGL